MLLLDLDGTCLTSDYMITDELCTIIRKYSSKMSIHIVTGRSVSDAWRYQRQLNLTSEMICYNGGITFDCVKREVKRGNYMKNAGWLLHSIFENKGQWGVENVIVSSVDRSYALNNENKYMCEMLRDKELPYIQSSFSEMEKIKTIQRIILSVLPERKDWLIEHINEVSSDVVTYGWAGRNEIVDISMNHVNKWTAVAELLKEKDIPADEVLAYGDSMSDLSMLQNVGVGVCMCNGNSELKQNVRYITQYDNNNNGVYFDMLERIEK